MIVCVPPIEILSIVYSLMYTYIGALYYLNNAGDCMERCRLDAAILALLLNCDTHLLSVVTNSLRVSQFSVTLDGQTTVTTTVSYSTLVHKIINFNTSTTDSLFSGRQLDTNSMQMNFMELEVYNIYTHIYMM